MLRNMLYIGNNFIIVKVFIVLHFIAGNNRDNGAFGS